MQDADRTDIYQISRNWADLVKRARSKQLAPDEYNSGNFTISNLGMFGADTFDAILPPGTPHLHCLHTCPRSHFPSATPGKTCAGDIGTSQQLRLFPTVAIRLVQGMP